jgi:hypothetical protein
VEVTGHCVVYGEYVVRYVVQEVRARTMYVRIEMVISSLIRTALLRPSQHRSANLVPIVHVYHVYSQGLHVSQQADVLSPIIRRVPISHGSQMQQAVGIPVILDFHE